MKRFLLLIVLLLCASIAYAQEEEPIIPVINSQSEIAEPIAPPVMRDVRSTNFGLNIEKVGDLLIVAAPEEFTVINNNFHRGSVYIYSRTGDSWALSQKIVNPENVSTAENASFGISTALDGNLLAIGSLGYGIYFYTFNGVEWVQSDLLLDHVNVQLWDYFGTEIALNGDLLVVSERQEVYAFRNIADVWTLEATFNGETTAPTSSEKFFGTAIAINDDNTVIAVGEPEQYTVDHTNPLGAVYVYAWNGTAWQLESTFVETGAGSFGMSLDMVGGGSQTLLVASDTGIYSDDEPAIDISGKAFAYSRSAGIWTKTLEFAAGSEIQFDQFGVSVELLGTPTNAALIVSSIPHRKSGVALAPARIYIFDANAGTQLGEIISPSDSDFDDDGQLDSDGFGREIELDGLGTSLELLVSSTGKELGDAKLYIFSHDPAPQEMVDAGDFELSPGRALVLDAWNVSPGAKWMCELGNCFIKFKSRFLSKAQQKVDLSQFALSPGDALLLQADVNVDGISSVTLKMNVIYTDGFRAKVNHRVRNTGGVFKTVMSAPAVFIANRPLAAIKIKVQHGFGSPAYLDNVSLVRIAGQ